MPCATFDPPAFLGDLRGTHLSEDQWASFGNDRSFLRQHYAEPSDPSGLWPNGTDHTNIKGMGIAEDEEVQDEFFEGLFDVNLYILAIDSIAMEAEI